MEMDQFKYLRVMVSADGDIGDEASQRLLEVRKEREKRKNMWKQNMMSREIV